MYDCLICGGSGVEIIPSHPNKDCTSVIPKTEIICSICGGRGAIRVIKPFTTLNEVPVIRIRFN